jgi:hypothetical protein
MERSKNRNGNAMKCAVYIYVVDVYNDAFWGGDGVGVGILISHRMGILSSELCPVH